MEGRDNKYEYVNNPAHYNLYPYDVIAMFRKVYGDEATSLWCEMTALKYRMRAGLKPGAPVTEDYEKELFYLNKAQEIYPTRFEKSSK